MPDGASVPRHRLHVVATSVAVILSMAVAGAASSCVESESTNTVQYWRSQSPTLRGKTTLKVGVQGDQPLMGLRDPQTGQYNGFDIEIAKIIAEGLGYQIELTPVTTPQRQSALQEGAVQLVVASFSITEERKKVVAFAGPYLAVRQQVLIPAEKADTIKTVSDLKKHRVCVINSSTSKERLLREGFTNLDVRSTNRECIDAIQHDETDALSTDATILAGFMDMYKGKFVVVDMGWDVSEELGIGLPYGDTWLEGLVGDILVENYKQGKNSRWQVAYNRNLAPVLGAKTQPVPKNAPDLMDITDRTSPRAVNLAAPKAPKDAVVRRVRGRVRGRGRR